MKKNKNHKEYEKLIVDWLGEEYDFEQFNIKKVNKELKKLSGRKKQ